MAHYRKAIQMDPQDALAHYNLGNALAEQRKPAEASFYFRRALELNPDFKAAERKLKHLSRNPA